MEIRHRFFDRRSFAIFEFSFEIFQSNFRSSIFFFFFWGEEEFNYLIKERPRRRFEIWKKNSTSRNVSIFIEKAEKFIASRSALPFWEKKTGNRGWLSGEKKKKKDKENRETQACINHSSRYPFRAARYIIHAYLRDAGGIINERQRIKARPVCIYVRARTVGFLERQFKL